MAEDSAEGNSGLQEPCSVNLQVNEHPRFPDWAEQAWRLWCRGQRNWSALARQFGVDYRTVQAAVRKYGEFVRAAARGSGVDAWQEAVTGQEEILGAAWAIHADPGGTNQEKVAALKVAQDSIGELAGLNGVITKRGHLQVTGPNEGPVQVQIVTVDALGEDDWTKTDAQ